MYLVPERIPEEGIGFPEIEIKDGCIMWVLEIEPWSFERAAGKLLTAELSL